MTQSRKITLIVLAVLVLAVLGYLALQLFGYQRAASLLPDSGTELLFVDQGKGERYVMDQTSLKRVVPEPLPDGVVVYESVPSPLIEGERVVLVVAPGLPGMVAGIAHADGDVTALVGGGTDKSNLIVREDGTVVFVTHPAVEVAPETSSDDMAEDGVEETGSADAPVATLAPVADTSGASRLVAVDLRTRVVRGLGLGHSPQLLENGMLRALSQEGVVDVNLDTGSRSVVQAFAGRLTPGGGISPSGEVVALAGKDPTTLQFYRLTPGTTPLHLGFVTLDGEDITRVTFTDEEHLFLRTNVTMARLYTIPTEKLPVATPVALVALVQ